MSNAGPSWTREFGSDGPELPAGSTFIHGSAELSDRTLLGTAWSARHLERGVTFFEVDSEEQDSFTARTGDVDEILSLWDHAELCAWVRSLGTQVFIDITSIALRTWAPIVHAALSVDCDFRVIYIEPAAYPRVTQNPGSGFDISELTEGIAAIPGFARIASTTNEQTPFVPLLGFEGNRLSRVIAKLEPPIDETFPILGVPGYLVEYPFYSMVGNRQELAKSFMHSRMASARANCPFDAFHALDTVLARLGDRQVQIAPLGTKPHALGAVLSALSSPSRVELVYDHPRRAVSPKTGISRVCLYYVSDFVRSAGYRRNSSGEPS